MKKILIVMLAVVMLLSIVACKKKTPANPNDGASASPTQSATNKPSDEPSTKPSASPDVDASANPSTSPDVDTSADPSMSPDVDTSAEPQSELAKELETILADATAVEVMLVPVTAIDLKDADAVNYFLGLDSVAGIREAVYAEPMMSSIAFSAILIQLEDGADVEKFKADVVEKVNERKWICVGADKIMANNSGSLVMFVMSDAMLADSVMAAFVGQHEGDVGVQIERIITE
ncbi:MAG: hypothetical protein PHT58_02675 [Eubacteriales bacterium]|nr:hypothetical protein [Eubacteriales bacterium]